MKKEVYREFSGKAHYVDNMGNDRVSTFTVYRETAATVTASELANLLKLRTIAQIKKITEFKIALAEFTFYL